MRLREHKMHRLISRVFPLLMSAALWAPTPLLAETPAGEQSYVVTLKPDASVDGAKAVAGQLAASYGGVVTDGGAAKGEAFVMRISAERARLVTADPRVLSVMPMQSGRAVPDAVESVSWTGGIPYVYDGSSNVRQIGNDAFAYDTAGRLVQATVNSVRRTYDYDAFGNRTACTQLSPNDCQLVTINASENRNRIREGAYDGAGNVTALGQDSYSYDALNMMTRDDSASMAHEFVYTADDERIATYTVGSSWRWTVREASGKVLREFSSQDGPSGPGSSAWKCEKDHVWRDGLLLASRQPEGEKTTTYHYHLDHLGTPRRVTDQYDRIVGVHDYFAFGPETAGGTAEPSLTALKYTGHERDSTMGSESFATLDYMHARYYSPFSGRFLSVDSKMDIEELLYNPQRWNRYTYVTDSPLRYFDPDGHDSKDPKGPKELSEAALTILAQKVIQSAPKGTDPLKMANMLILKAGDFKATGKAISGALNAAGIVLPKKGLDALSHVKTISVETKNHVRTVTVQTTGFSMSLPSGIPDLRIAPTLSANVASSSSSIDVSNVAGLSTKVGSITGISAHIVQYHGHAAIEATLYGHALFAVPFHYTPDPYPLP
jgi:RHS repeat-associated protein